MKTAKKKRIVLVSPAQLNGALPVHLAVFSGVPLRGHNTSHPLFPFTTSSDYSTLKRLATAIVTPPLRI